jgi:hypothetical protein
MNGRTRRIWVGAAAVVAALGAAHAPAGAKQKVDSFDGSCAFEGNVRFSPPATNRQQPLHVVYDAVGSCTGTLNGRDVSDAPVSAHNVARRVDGSCLRADTTEPGRAAITFADGTTIRSTYEFHFVATEGTVTFQGERSGSGEGTGTFLTDRTPPDVALQCAGDGAAEAPLDISFATESPLVSKRAQRRAKPRTAGPASTFSGSCSFAGAVVFDPPLTDDPQAIGQRVVAPGTCSGTFVDRRGREHALSDSPVTFSESSKGENASCAAGRAIGAGTLRFRRGTIRFGFSETRATGTVVGEMAGAKSGSAHGYGGIDESEDKAAILERCAGEGLTKVKIYVEAQTTPSISG